MPLASIIYEETLSGGAGKGRTKDLPIQTPAFQTAENRRQEALDNAAPQGPAKKTTGRAAKNLSTVPAGTQVSGPGLLNAAATPAKMPAAPTSPGATREGHLDPRMAARLAKAKRQRDDEESMMIMLLATRPQNGSAVQPLGQPQELPHV